MDHFIMRFFAKNRLNFVGPFSENPAKIPAIVVHHSATKDFTVRRFELHNISLIEIPLHLNDPTGQQTFFRKQCLIGPTIDYDAATSGR